MKEQKQTVEPFIAERLQLDFLFPAKQGKSGFSSPSLSGATLGQLFCCFAVGYAAVGLHPCCAHVNRACPWSCFSFPGLPQGLPLQCWAWALAVPGSAALTPGTGLRKPRGGGGALPRELRPKDTKPPCQPPLLQLLAVCQVRAQF